MCRIISVAVSPQFHAHASRTLGNMPIICNPQDYGKNISVSQQVYAAVKIICGTVGINDRQTVLLLDRELFGRQADNRFEQVCNIKRMLDSLNCVIVLASHDKPDQLRAYRSGADIFLPAWFSKETFEDNVKLVFAKRDSIIQRQEGIAQDARAIGQWNSRRKFIAGLIAAIIIAIITTVITNMLSKKSETSEHTKGSSPP